MRMTRTMSSRTAGVAVAVRATTGVPGKEARTPLSSLYALRKSWPHMLMQCASSTTSRLSRPCAAAGETRARGGAAGRAPTVACRCLSTENVRALRLVMRSGVT